MGSAGFLKAIAARFTAVLVWFVLIRMVTSSYESMANPALVLVSAVRRRTLEDGGGRGEGGGGGGDVFSETLQGTRCCYSVCPLPGSLCRQKETRPLIIILECDVEHMG